MSEIRSVCVFCGSRKGARPSYASTARRLGERLAAEGVGLVSGGGRVGLMGVVADAVLSGGGTAVGVIPKALAAREIGHTALTELHVVGTMHERKAMMASLADAFVALPGGLGTLEEIAEAMTWGGLGIHAKPCAVLDVDGYYSPLLGWLDHGVDQGFISADARAALVVETDPDVLLDRLLGGARPVADGATGSDVGDSGGAATGGAAEGGATDAVGDSEGAARPVGGDSKKAGC